MPPLFETVTDLREQAERLRRRYGVIEVVDGELRRVVLRPWPKIVSAPGIWLFGGWHHRHCRGDRVLLYYNQPLRFPNFLVLSYFQSARDTTFRSVRRALGTLDEIARLKQSDAILCDVANWRISPRALARFGWAPHCPARWHRHYIKRFYGTYPALPNEAADEVTVVCATR
jgi:hypothetical protein